MPKNLIEVYNQSLTETEFEAAQAISALITKGTQTTKVNDESSIIRLDLKKITASLKSDSDVAILSLFHRQNQQNDDKPEAQYKWVISQLQEVGIPDIISPATDSGKGWKNAIAAGFPDKYFGLTGPGNKGILEDASYQYNLIYAGMKGNFLLIDLVMMEVTETSGKGMDIWSHYTDLFYVTLDVMKIAKYIDTK